MCHQYRSHRPPTHCRHRAGSWRPRTWSNHPERRDRLCPGCLCRHRRRHRRCRCRLHRCRHRLPRRSRCRCRPGRSYCHAVRTKPAWRWRRGKPASG
ncbi:MAG: hypothetical protein CL928_19510 [Deltaproteobacteria bacterium]|nr:hypothetical protein [Deltaproteobacteria bacterium]